jgi:hypothetical protein
MDAWPAPTQSPSGLEKGIWIDGCLPQYRAERPFGHVARMIWNCCVSDGPRVVPDLVTAGGLTIELESAGLETSERPRDNGSPPGVPPMHALRWCSRNEPTPWETGPRPPVRGEHL